MKRNELFVVKKIGEAKYLLPVGQMIAEFNKGIKINETCEYVWEQLKEDVSFEDLLERSASHYSANEEEIIILQNDLHELIKALKNRGMLEGSRSIYKCGCIKCRTGQAVREPEYPGILTKDTDIGNFEAPVLRYYCIGGLPVEISCSEDYLEKSFEEFRTDNYGINPMHIEIIDISRIKEFFDRKETGYYDTDLSDEDNSENIPADTKTGQKEENISDNLDFVGVLLHHSDLTVLEYTSEYVLFFNELKGVKELHMTKDGYRVKAYCEPASEEVRLNLFHAVRISFLIYALNNGRVMLHSCSILYDEKVWAFSGHSGTGKSTHCNIWKKLYNVPVINGDLNLIGTEDGIPYVYGTPWCGSSEIFDNQRRILGGIVLLKQDARNHIEELSNEQKILYVQQRLTTSILNREMLDKTFDIVEGVVKNIYVKRYYCNKADEAGTVIHDDIADF